jgi:hypothetical protein
VGTRRLGAKTPTAEKAEMLSEAEGATASEEIT